MRKTTQYNTYFTLYGVKWVFYKLFFQKDDTLRVFFVSFRSILNTVVEKMLFLDVIKANRCCYYYVCEIGVILALSALGVFNGLRTLRAFDVQMDDAYLYNDKCKEPLVENEPSICFRNYYIGKIRYKRIPSASTQLVTFP